IPVQLLVKMSGPAEMVLNMLGSITSKLNLALVTLKIGKIKRSIKGAGFVIRKGNYNLSKVRNLKFSAISLLTLICLALMITMNLSLTIMSIYKKRQE